MAQQRGHGPSGLLGAWIRFLRTSVPLSAPSRFSHGNRRHRRASMETPGLGTALAVGGSLAGCQAQPAAEVGVHSHRHDNTDRDLYGAVIARTGIRVRPLEGQDSALIEFLTSPQGGRSYAAAVALMQAKGWQ
jgi:hypothetical protein